MKRTLLLLWIPFLAISLCMAQENIQDDSQVHSGRRFALSAKGNTLLAGGLSFDGFITPRINAELSGSIFLTTGIEGGLNVYPFRNFSLLSWKPYIGLHPGFFVLNFLSRSDFLTFTAPVGLHYMAKNGLNLSMDVGYSLQRISDYHAGDFDPYKTAYYNRALASIKIGYRFRGKN